MKVRKIDGVFMFGKYQYQAFRSFLYNLKDTPEITWPGPEDGLKYPGLPLYSLARHFQENGKPFLIVRFDDMVILPDGTKARIFKVGGDPESLPLAIKF